MKFTKIAAALVCLLTFSLNIYAFPGDLDTTFDGDGKATVSVGANDYPQDVAIQPDGKIVLVGFTSVEFNNSNADLSLARFNADGSVDTGFGTGGTVILAGEAGSQIGNAVLILPDGKILVVGYDVPHFTVFRFNANGSVDNTYGTNGRVKHAIGIAGNGDDGVLQPDGKLVAAGYVQFTGEAFRFTVFRLNTDGSLDTSFNSIGYTPVLFGGTVANAVALQSDGKIIAAGGHFNEDRGRWGRFSADGILEGGVSALVLAEPHIYDVAIQPDGKFVFAGTSRPVGGGLPRMTVTRFNTDKTIDLHFGNGGVNWVSWASMGGSIGRAESLFIQPSGRIVVGGEVFVTNHAEFAIARFGAHGFLDTGFGNGGRVMTLFGGGKLHAMAPQADGKFIAVGESWNGSNYDFGVARYDGSDSNTAQTRSQFDWDGDGRADVSVYRPSTATFYIFNSGNSTVTVRTFGNVGDVPIPGDYDGDVKTDFAIYRPTTGQWWYAFSGGSGFPQTHTNAIVGDHLRPGDFTGDGRADLIAYTSANGLWRRRDITNTVNQDVVFGAAGDKPVLGDFDGDAKVDPAVYRPSTGEWWYAASSAGGAHRAARWGISSDIPAPADFDGDHKTDFAVYRPSEGIWYIFNSSDGSFTILNFGLAEDKPVAADYDGDGKADIAVFRPSTGVWYLMRSTAGFTAMQFGVSTDVPIPNAFVP